MPNYRRAFVPGGTFFFTLVTAERRPIFNDAAARTLLRDAIANCRRARPMDMPAMVLLPDHLHAICRLPEGDSDFSSRWSHIKSGFTRRWLAIGGGEAVISLSQKQSRRRGVWQRQFWEHCLRDQEDFNRHLDYIHFNPVKHGLASCAHAWPWSSFRDWVARGYHDETGAAPALAARSG